MAVAEQAVILAAGRGTRLQKPDPLVQLDEATEAIVRQGYKALVPIGGRQYLDYSIERLIRAGIRRIVLVIGPGALPMERYAARLAGRFPSITAEHVVQPEARGTG
ncbi:MAG: NTP transferase domain-containing protein, partial [Chloroflexi bacterium]|nr:NTP transferase domain-containing protein [Chloroflexota bacterium]